MNWEHHKNTPITTRSMLDDHLITREGIRQISNLIDGWREIGHLTLQVTLMTMVKDKSLNNATMGNAGADFAATPFFHDLWNKNLINCISKRLPQGNRQNRVEHFYGLHSYPSNHFHGVVIVPKRFAHLVWMGNQNAIHPRIDSELKSWEKNLNGMRPCRVTKYEIKKLDKEKYPSSLPWIRYCANEDQYTQAKLRGV